MTGLAAAVGLALTACSSGGAGGGVSGASGPTTITFASSMFGDPGTGAQLQALVDEFNASQGAVRVEPASIPFSTFAQTILTQMGGGLGPDVIRFDTTEFYTALSGKLLAPLNIDAKQYGLEPAADKFMFQGDKRYGVVFNINSNALMYNADLVPNPPKTFDEFLATAKQVTGNGVFGTAFRTTLPEANGVWGDIWNYVYGFGGSYSDGQKLTLNSPGVVKGLNAYKEIYDANVIPKGATASDYRTMFGQNKLGMEIDSAGLVNTLRGMNPNLNIKAVPIPFPVRRQGEILAAAVVNSASKHKTEAETFIKWLVTPGSQAKLQGVVSAGAAAVPPKRSTEELAKTPFLTVFDDLIATSEPMVVVGFEAQTPTIRKIVVEQVVNVLQGQGDMQSAMDAAQQQATAAVGG